MASITVRLDDTLKNDASEVLGEMGLDAPTAMRIMLKQIVNRRVIPFDIYAEDMQPNAVTIAAIEEGRRFAADPSAKRYSNFSEILDEI